MLAMVSLPVTAIADNHVAHRPVFQLDVRNPTADKPQSKLWFAYDTWWAWLPNRQGSSVWRRTEQGWRREESLDTALRDIPGRADVWHEGELVRAVLVDRRQLHVVTLHFDPRSDHYVVAGKPQRFDVDGKGKQEVIETATIVRDGVGRWWIAYPWQEQMWVRATPTATDSDWTEPIAVSETTAADDLCTLVKLPRGIGLAWSNQKMETMNFREHQDAADLESWAMTEEIDRGNRTADDHLNAKVAADGTLFLATKNSVDRVGQPQLVLRVRAVDGRWSNWPFAARTETSEPSRPLALLGDTPTRLFLIYTRYDRGERTEDARREDRIVWQSASLASLNAAALDTPADALLGPAPTLNNVTGCKQNLPERAPWIVLASDAQGNVYEGQLNPAAQRPVRHP